jgi:PKD repeat protein
MTLLKAPNDSLKALLTASGNGLDVVFYHITPQGEVSEGYYYGGDEDYEFGRDFVRTPDGNYAFIGFGNALANGGADIYYGKISPTGALLWQYVVGEQYTDFGHAITNTQDGGLLLGGFSQSTGSPNYYRSYLIKTDEHGQVEWEKVFTHDNPEEIYDVVQLPNGTIVAAGYYQLPQSFKKDALLYLLEPDGSLIRQIRFGGAGDEVIEAIMVSPEGGFMAAGHTESYSFGEGDLFLAEFDENGTQLWGRIIGSEMDERGYDGMGLDMDANGNLLLTGFHQLGPFADERQGLLLKTNRQGDLLWTRLLEDATQPSAVVAMDNNDIVVGGGNSSFSYTTNFLFRTNASGRTQCGRDSFLQLSVQALIFPATQDTGSEVLDLNTQNTGPALTDELLLFNQVLCSTYCEVRADIWTDSPIAGINDLVQLNSNSINATEHYWWVNGDSIAAGSSLDWQFSLPGTYDVQLIARDTSCADTAYLNLYALPPAAANFDYYQELMVVLFDGTLSSGSNWHWDFGDGTSSTEPRPKHIFPSLGTYEVCLTVEGAGGQDTHCRTIEVAVEKAIAFAQHDSLNAFTTGTKNYAVVRSKDGGFATVGYSLGSSSPYNLLLQKYRADGTVNWRSVIGGNSVSTSKYGYALTECHDLGYLVGGEIYESGPNDGILISRTDSLGQLIWSYNIDASAAYNAAYDMLQTPDRGFLVCGERNNHAFLLKLDRSGKKEWYKEYYDGITATAIRYNEDGSVYLAANSVIGSILFLHLDVQGEILTSKTFEVDGLITNAHFSKATSPDGGFYIGCNLVTDQNKIAVLKLDAEGNLAWSRVFLSPNPGTGSVEAYLQETSDQHLYLSLGGFFNDSYAAIAYLDQDATPLWGKRLHLNSTTGIRTADLTYNDHLITAGNRSNTNNFYKTAALFQIGPDGQLCNTTTINLGESQESISTASALTDSVRIYSPPLAHNNFISGPGTRAQEVYCYNDISCSPTAGFTLVADNNIIYLTNLSENYDSVVWSLGDGTTYAEENPEHLYTTSGTYTICVTAINSCGSVSSCQSVNIDIQSCAPQAAFAFSLPEPEVVQFFDNSTAAESWSWSFGDGATSTEQQPVHTYPIGGNYTVCLTVNNSCGTDIQCQSIYVEGCEFSAFFTYQTMGYSVSFSSTTSNVDSWAWDFGDGNISNDSQPMHTYEFADIYEVCLTVSGECGAETYCESVLIIEEDCTPEAAFVFEQFEATGFSFIEENINATSWLWDFGDGNTSTEAYPTHYYSEAGTYTVCLTAYNECGEDFTCQEIEVAACAPTAGFAFEQSGLFVQFYDESLEAYSWVWDFGDGNISTEPQPAHTYEQAGAYDACLMVENVCGMDTLCQLISIVIDQTAQRTQQELYLYTWPNPVGNQLFIQLLNASAPRDSWAFELLNQHGQAMALTFITGRATHTLDTSAYPSGLYYYRLSKAGMPVLFGKVMKI